MKRFCALLCALLLLLSLSACSPAVARRTVFAMDTVFNLTVYNGGEETLSRAEWEIRALEALLSRTDEDSALYALNRDGETDDGELARVLALAMKMNELTDGAFDPTIAPVMDAWGFTKDAHRVPDDEELAALLQRVGAAHVTLREDYAALERGTAVDLGGLAKGYAADVLRELFSGYERVKSASLDLGGDVCLIGAKPDGSDWRIAIKDPVRPDSFLGVLSVHDTCVVTSGVYERFFELGGVRYHHIIDPATGKPTDNGLISVTAVCEKGVYADALSTACFVLGEEASLALREKLLTQEGLELELLFVTDDGRVRYTDGLAKSFDPSAGKGAYVYEIIP